MNRFVTRRRAGGFVLAGVLLLLSSVWFYVFDRTGRNYTAQLQEAAAQAQAQNYLAAITAYQQVLARTQALDIRLYNMVFGRRISTEHIRLSLANSHYRLAEATLRQYQAAASASSVVARPTLTTVQRLLTTAVQAFDAVSDTDPRAYVSAQVNAGRAEAWQLLLAATHEQTSGRRALSQLAAQTIERVAHAVDFAHQQRQHLQRQEWMTAILLLEALTRFSRERPPLPRPVAGEMESAVAFGDLLLHDTPELSADARQRFQNFFFALPFEADNPWPTQPQGDAGADLQRALH